MKANRPKHQLGGPDTLRSRRPIQRLLVPLDFSRHSLRALLSAMSLAGPMRANISLLHVVVPDTYPLTHPGQIGRVTKRLALAESKLRRLQAALQRRGMVGEIHARVGLPFEQITAAASELKADLLVMASHGRTGLARLLWGSTAETVFRQSPCPVLVMRHGRTAASPRKAGWERTITNEAQPKNPPPTGKCGRI